MSIILFVLIFYQQSRLTHIDDFWNVSMFLQYTTPIKNRQVLNLGGKIKFYLITNIKHARMATKLVLAINERC